ncbi:MAG: DUF4251 domain-containing protein [Bacteroidota bacterium]|nr:DUF4251 domain-containing protein [Bacteroidota bacterium]
MKRLNNLLTFLFLIICAAILFGCSNTKNLSNGQITDRVSLRNMIESHDFVFIAQSVNAVGVRRRDLTSGYQISISKDTIVSYLPFFGRGYTAPLSPTDVDFDFTSTKFSYSITPARRGWNILIKPMDQSYLHELYFWVFDNGYASLNIVSINRSFVSYDGYISERKKK